MKRLMLFACTAFIAAPVSAESMGEWLVGEWRPVPHYILREIEIDGHTAYEPTSAQEAGDPTARTLYRADGTMVTPDGESALWSIEKSGDDWAVIVQKTTSSTIVVTIIRENEDTAMRVSRMSSGTLLYGSLKRVE